MLIQVGEYAPEVDETAWLAPTATVIGRVRLAAGVSIWYGAVLRGDVEDIVVGERTNVQDNCVFHSDAGFPLTLGSGISVGHNATLHGCTIGDDVLVGMGATVLNGATVGAGTLIAANALIPEGAQIPPNSLVAGVPGKVRRDLRPEEHEKIRHNAVGYQRLAEVHRAGTMR
ncbi:MAG TPA: gamma carbonic anhydrase family protein [Aldersonia sp.]